MINRDEEYRRAWESALRLLNYRERSRKELTDKLAEKKYTRETVLKVVKRLEELELLDDEKFSRLWVRSRLRFKPRSAWLISRELRDKGIDEELIRRIVEEEFTPEQEMEAAMILAEKRFEHYLEDEPTRARRKLFAYLARRGFSPDMIWKCLERVMKFDETQ